METKMKRGSFIKAIWALMLPIVLQNLLSAVVNTADVMMITGVSQSALSATSLAGQVVFVLTLFYLGIGMATSVLAAQYWGKRDRRKIAETQGFALKLNCGISTLFFLMMIFLPETLMRIYTDDEELIHLGILYLRWISPSAMLMGITQIWHAVMRSMEQTKKSAQITTICLLCNIALNAIAVYLLFPNKPEGASCGVAAATTVARGVELALCVAAIKKGNGVISTREDLRKTEKRLQGTFLRTGLPVQANYLIWGIATSMIAAIIGHLGSDMVAANSLAGTLRNLVIIGCTGLGEAGSIMVGNELGKGDYDNARWIGDQVFAGSLLLGLLSGLLLIPLYWPCLALSGLSQKASELFWYMLIVNAVYCIGKSFNSSLVGGVFCAGGDTKFGLICDTVVMWGVILPLGYCAAFIWNWPVMAVYVILFLDEFVKMPLVIRHFREYKWVKNLT